MWRTSSLTRIESSSVQLGNSYVFGQSKAVSEQELFKRENEQKQQIIDEANAQAAQILEKANEQAEQILADAQNQAEQLKQDALNQGTEEGQKQGYDNGYVQAVEQAKQDLQEQVEKTEVLAQSAFEIKQNIVKSSEKEIAEMVIMIAEKVIRKKIELDPEIIINITKDALNNLKEKEEVKLIVNPSLTKCLMDFSDDIKAVVNGLKTIKFVEDRTVKPNGLIVESVDTRIDARLETQIELIAQKLISEAVNNPNLKNLPAVIDEEIEQTAQKKRSKRKSDD